MLKQNKRHLTRVALYGGILTAVAAAAGYIVFSVKSAYSVLAGAALSLANIYSIILLVEAVAGAALESTETGVTGPPKAAAMVMHLLKLGVIVVLIAVLVISRAVDMPGFLAGFTVVLVVHGATGFMKARENLLIEEAEAAEAEAAGSEGDGTEGGGL